MTNLRNRAYRALRWSENLFKTDMVYLAKGGFWVTFSQVITSLMSFLLALAFANFVSQEVYGEYKYVLSLAGILGLFTLTGLGSSVLRSVSKGHDGTLQYAFWKNIKWSILLFLGALIGSIYYLTHGNNSLGIAMLIVGTFSPFLRSSNLYSSFLSAKKDFRRHSIYFDFFGNIFPYLALFATMVLTQDPLWLVSVYFISNTITGLILYWRVKTIYKPDKNDVDTEFLNYGKHLSIMSTLSGIAGNIDQVLAFHYLGAAQLAVYNFAIAIPDQSKGLLKGFNKLIFPKFVERNDQEIHRGINSKFLRLLVASVIMITVYVILAPYIFKIFFPQYINSVFYSQIFSVSLLSITFSPATVYLAAKKKIRAQYISSILTSITQIAVVFIGILLWGLLGLIIARVATRMVNSITNFVLFRNTAQSTPN